MLFIDKIIVRNNDKFLYCGTYFEVEPEGDDDDERRGQWMLRGFDITTRTWFDDSLNIPAMIGSDIGSTVCFEILDGYFYGLSNQTSLQVELVDWVSHYTCFRFPLSRTGFQDLESPSRNQLWRRNQTEGPIDDRWRFLRMEKDETTGQLKIVECRKEWLSCNTSARRTYYTTPISFGEPGKSSNKRHSLIEGLSLDKVRQVAVSRSSARDPHMVHPDDDTLTLTTMPNKCPIRSYHSGSQTIIDLVDDSPSLDSRDQRIRICGRTRRLAPGALAQQDARTVEPAQYREISRGYHFAR
ncbi:hypothetical protein N0V88_000899 [Collariella sp. IMI 366227]|nr:hypothetical protein N0V88_000899 [Collariella sp. IMI 366227]